MAEEKHKFDESVEGWISKIVIDEEFSTAKSASTGDMQEFESLVDMLECRRNEKDYEWMSDIFIPELPSIVLTDASGWANQYFQTRDFVEVKLEGTGPKDEEKCIAAKKCINGTLNNKKIHHYQKYMRGRTINSLASAVYALCWWEKKLVPRVVRSIGTEELTVDVEGNALIPGSGQVPATREVINEDVVMDVVVDRFNYDIFDPRNVFTSGKYSYSPQDKPYIIFRDEVTYEDLKREEKDKGYFNLDLVKGFIESQLETETSKETYNKGDANKEPEKPIIRRFDRLLRFGKFWAVVKASAPDGYPIEIVPGYDRDGKILEKAELIEAIMEFVVPKSGNVKILIRFQPTPFRDSKGEPYKPIARGLCYIHPTKDTGLSDGRYLRELQIAINDNFNMGADRVKLSTIPTLKGRKYSLEDNPTIRFEPEHVMELEDVKDIEEFKIDPNIDGTMNVNTMLISFAEKVEAIYPTTMGSLPEKASTTATAIGAAEYRTNARANYKSLTFEFTFLLDFYWMILQMTYRFAEEETALKLMGDSAEAFDPDQDYTYSPLTSNIEAEYRKDRKIQQIDQIMGRLVNFPNPKTVKVLNKLLSMIFEAYGNEYAQFKGYLLDEQAPMVSGSPTTPKNMGPIPTTNQTGTPQSSPEQMVRNRML